MKIEVLSKIRDIVGKQIGDYIIKHAGNVHTSPHVEVLRFAQDMLTEVTLILQKEIVENSQSVKTSEDDLDVAIEDGLGEDDIALFDNDNKAVSVASVPASKTESKVIINEKTETTAKPTKAAKPKKEKAVAKPVEEIDEDTSGDIAYVDTGDESESESEGEFEIDFDDI